MSAEISKFLQGFSGPGGFITGTTTDTGQSILGGGTGGGVESGLSTRTILNQIQDLVDRNIVQSTQFQFEKVQVPLFDLGQASQEISSALNQQIQIREQQRAVDQESVRNQQILQTSINEQFTSSLGDLSKSLGDLGKGGFDPIGFFTDNPLIGGIGIGGLLVGGVVLLVLLR